MFTRVIATTLVLFLSSAFGQLREPTGSDQAKAIRREMICMADFIGIGQAKNDVLRSARGDRDAEKSYLDYTAKLNKCLEDGLSPAIAAAGDNADLKAAIKDFYIKAGEYVVVLGMNDSQAQHDESEAMSKVAMEMKLAGIK